MVGEGRAKTKSFKAERKKTNKTRQTGKLRRRVLVREKKIHSRQGANNNNNKQTKIVQNNHHHFKWSTP